MIKKKCKKKFLKEIFPNHIDIYDKLDKFSDDETLVLYIGNEQDVDSKVSKISRQMQKYYFGVILKTILDFNQETGIYKDNNTGMQYETVEELDYLMRYCFYYNMVDVNGVELRMPKTLKLSKANRPEVCHYFDRIMKFFASKHGLVIPSPDDGWFNDLLDEYNRSL